MSNYYLHYGAVQTGPFTIDELKGLNIKSNSLVWNNSLSGWTPAGQVDELKHLFTSIPPPLPPTPISENRSLMRIILVVAILTAGFFIYRSINQDKKIADVEKKNDDLTDKVDEQEKANQEKAEREAANTAKNMNYRNNWANYIAVGKVRYEFSALGGIDPFEIPVINNTEYTLDEVNVNVDYIKQGGGIYKSETVTIYNVPPNSTKSESTTKSPRGTSVNISIAGIISRRFHFCYPVNNGNPSDPYFCK